jgi:hypothetical protein
LPPVLRVFSALKTPGHEKDISTLEPKKKEQAWIPDPHGLAWRTECTGQPQGQGQEKTDRFRRKEG